MDISILGNLIHYFDIYFQLKLLFYLEMLKISPLKWNLLPSHFCCNAFGEASFLRLALPSCPGAGVEPRVTQLSPSGGEAKEKQPRPYPVHRPEEVRVLSR